MSEADYVIDEKVLHSVGFAMKMTTQTACMYLPIFIFRA